MLACKQYGEVGGGGRLADAALLVADRDDHPAASFGLSRWVGVAGRVRMRMRGARPRSAKRTSRPSSDAVAASSRPNRLLVHPARCCGSGEHELSVAVDGDQPDRVEPDREHVLADASLKLTPDLPPDAQILGARDVEAPTDLIEVDADRSSPAPPSIGDVALLDDHPALGAPPSRGVGGVPGSGVQGFPSRARVGWRGFWRGFGGVYAANPAQRPDALRQYPAQDRTLSSRYPAQAPDPFDR